MLPILGATALLYALRVPLALRRMFDPDELQHLHGGYSVASGLVPYVDYFEHHPPWFAWFTAGIVRLGGPEWGTILAARLAMLPFTLAIVVLTWMLASSASSRRVAAAAVLFLSTVFLFVDRSIEVRPDVPASALWLVALHLLVSAARSRSRGRFIAAGLALGSGMMFTPKLALGALGAGVGLGVFLLRRGARPGALLQDALAVMVAAVVPLAATLAILALQGAAGGFVEHVVLGPVSWPRELSAWRFTDEFFTQNPATFVLGALGVLALLHSARTDEDPATSVIGGAALALTIGWFVVPVPWPQYLLPLFPLWSIAAARVFVAACERIEPRSRGAKRLALATVGLATAALLVVLVQEQRSNRMEFVAIAGLLAVAIGAVRAPERLGLALLLLMLAAPIARITAREAWTHAPIRSEFDLIMSSTAPDETVLTSWRGSAVFRPHAYHFFFLHPGMLARMSAAQKEEELLEVLTARPPAAVVRDEYTRELGPGVNSFIERSYAPSGVGDVWLARGRVGK